MDIKTVSDSFPLFLMMGVLALGFFCASYVLGTTGTNIDLSSPEATIKTYCEAVIRADVSAVKQCIYEGNKVEEKSFEKPIWSSCRIVKVQQTKDIGRYLGDGTRLFSQSGDVEIVQEVKMIHPAKGNPKTKFWYLLRKFDAQWKIISHSHIPDKNYPPLD